MPNLLVRVCRRAIATSTLNARPLLSSRDGWRPMISSQTPSAEIVCSTKHFSQVAGLNYGDHSDACVDNDAVKNTNKDVASAISTSPPKGDLSIVFTDIVKSTDIWEKDPSAMVSGMQVHDNIIRNYVQTYKGYEVKQNGDGFMIAFPTAIFALQFCLAVQQQLLDQEWPEDLTKLTPGKELKDDDGNILFRGLRVRMSAHWGKPAHVWNDVIKRMDYLGPMVNRAARFIQVTEGGQIVVSEDFLLEIQRSAKDSKSESPKELKNDDPVLDLSNLQCRSSQKVITDQHFEVKLLGEHHLKGLPEAQKLYFIIPESLHGRLELWPKHKYVAGSKGNIVSCAK